MKPPATHDLENNRKYDGMKEEEKKRKKKKGQPLMLGLLYAKVIRIYTCVYEKEKEK